MAITVLAAAPDVVGIQLTAWVEIAIVAVMSTISYLFGLVGFLGAEPVRRLRLGTWTEFAPFGAGAIVTALALAFWSFVSIEFVTPLVEETPARAEHATRDRRQPVHHLDHVTVMGLGIIGAVEPGSWTSCRGTPRRSTPSIGRLVRERYESTRREVLESVEAPLTSSRGRPHIDADARRLTARVRGMDLEVAFRTRRQLFGAHLHVVSTVTRSGAGPSGSGRLPVGTGPAAWLRHATGLGTRNWRGWPLD